MMDAERENIQNIKSMGKAELRLALLFQAFLPVPGWRQWDTGNVGYSLDIEGDEESSPRLIVRCDDLHSGWRWYVIAPTGSGDIVAQGKHYRLACDAVRDGTEALHKHFPGTAIKKPTWSL